MYVKVSKSQKHFALNSKKRNNILGKILPYEARAEFYPILSLFFGEIEFQEKLLFRYITWIVVTSKYVIILFIVRQLFKGDNYSREETINY